MDIGGLAQPGADDYDALTGREATTRRTPRVSRGPASLIRNVSPVDQLAEIWRPTHLGQRPRRARNRRWRPSAVRREDCVVRGARGRLRGTRPPCGPQPSPTVNSGRSPRTSSQTALSRPTSRSMLDCHASSFGVIAGSADPASGTQPSDPSNAARIRSAASVAVNWPARTCRSISGSSARTAGCA